MGFLSSLLAVLTLGQRRKGGTRRARSGKQGRRRKPAPVASISLSLELEEEGQDNASSSLRVVPSARNCNGSSQFPLTFTPPAAFTLSGVQHQATGGNGSSSTELQPRPQRLITAGSRVWGSGGWMDARSFLNVRLFDFAVYVDEQKLQQHLGEGSFNQSSQSLQQAKQMPPHAWPLSRQLPWLRGSLFGAPAPEPEGGSLQACSTQPGAPTPCEGDLLAQLLQARDVPVSVVLRAARDLPVALLQQEMGRVLQRRYTKAGGTASAGELKQLLECFSASRLPRALCSGQEQVRCGATLAFCRGPGGLLSAAALPGAMLEAHYGSSTHVASSLQGQQETQSEQLLEPEGLGLETGLLLPQQRHYLTHSSSSHRHMPGQHKSVLDSIAGTGGLAQQLVHSANGVAAALTGTSHIGDSTTSSAGGTHSLTRSSSAAHESAQCSSSSSGGGVGAVPLLCPGPSHTPLLSHSLLDLYLGDEPVSVKAKVAACASVRRLLDGDSTDASEGASRGGRTTRQQRRAQAAAAAGVVYEPLRGQSIECTGSHCVLRVA